MRQAQINKGNPKLRIGRKKYIYFIGHHNLVKIGIADNVLDRLVTIQVTCPSTVHIVTYFPSKDAFADEILLHKRFEPFHIRGEWYRIPKIIMDDFLRQIDTLSRERGNGQTFVLPRSAIEVPDSQVIDIKRILCGNAVATTAHLETLHRRKEEKEYNNNKEEVAVGLENRVTVSSRIKQKHVNELLAICSEKDWSLSQIVEKTVIDYLFNHDRKRTK